LLAAASEHNVRPRLIKTVNLEEGMPQVHQALSQLDLELRRAQEERCSLVKLIHGYGSSGTGGDIRTAVQRKLREMADHGQIRGCIFGEDWSKSDDQTWPLLRTYPELKQDRDLGKKNRGITIVVL
jgi:hypothetical protein